MAASQVLSVGIGARGAGPLTAGRTRSGSARLDSIDLLRGLVIVIMVLDHVRAFLFLNSPAIEPTDAEHSYLALYFTRWITHLCAPTFVMLAGVSIFLQKCGGKPLQDLSRFLVTRGLWLLLLEVTIVSFGFNFAEPFFFLQIIWAIGVSMIAMAVIVRLEPRTVLVVGALLVALSPTVAAAIPGARENPVGIALLGVGKLDQWHVAIGYPVLPWLGVMCIGFGLGPLFRLDASERLRTLLPIALALLAGAVAMRILMAFAPDPQWRVHDEPVRTMMAFLDFGKTPPGPDFVASMLGLSLLLFLAVEHLRGPAARILRDFGQVPLFAYVSHLYIGHGIALAIATAQGVPQRAIDTFGHQFWPHGPVQPWGVSLPLTYAIWLATLAIMIPLTRWFAQIKRSRRDWWLSYL